MMLSAVQTRVLVQRGGRVEFSVPELPEGAEADVIVLLRSDAAVKQLTPLEALDELQKCTQLTPEVAEQWIRDARTERERWGHRG